MNDKYEILVCKVIKSKKNNKTYVAGIIALNEKEVPDLGATFIEIPESEKDNYEVLAWYEVTPHIVGSRIHYTF